VVYLAQQPINTVYYLGSSLVFRTLFTMISDKEDGVSVGSPRDRTKQGLNIAIRDASQANVNLHRVLYGLIERLLVKAEGKPLHTLRQDRIDIKGAPDPDTVRLPLFLDIPQPSSRPRRKSFRARNAADNLIVDRPPSTPRYYWNGSCDDSNGA